MLTARRLHERERQAAAGLPPAAPAPPSRPEISWQEHESALLALETRLRAELEGTRSTHVVELSLDDEPFKSEVAKLVADFEARFKEAIEEGDAEIVELQAKLGEAAKTAEESAAKLAELEGVNKALAEQLELVAAEKAAAVKELLEWQAAADVPSAKAAVAEAEAAATETPAATPPDASAAQSKSGKKQDGKTSK